MKKQTTNKGFMAVEILIAVSIIVIFVLVAMTVAQKSIYISRQALHATQAAFLLEEGAENTRIIRDNNWEDLVALNTSEQIGIFNRSVVVSEVSRNEITGDIGSGVVDPRTKLITVTVSWPEGGQTISKTLQFYVADIFSE